VSRDFWGDAFDGCQHPDRGVPGDLADPVERPDLTDFDPAEYVAHMRRVRQLREDQ